MSIRTLSRSFWALATGVLAIVLSVLNLAPAQAQNTYQTFDSTVRLYKCSGSLVRMPGSSYRDQALIMTSAHCLIHGSARYLEPGEVITNYSLKSLDRLYFRSVNLHKGDYEAEYLTSANITDIVYATMDESDLAILRLDKTYAQLRLSGVKARPLSSTPPAVGTPIQIPSAFWQKAYACKIDAIAPELHEGP